MSEADHTELWKEINSFPGYRVSLGGVVESCHIPGARGKTSDRWRALKPIRLPNGYLVVSLWHKGTLSQHYIHHLVLTAFVDGNKENCRLENLAWGTHRDNEADKDRHGTRLIGSRHHRAKLTEAQVIEIRAIYDTGAPLGEIARRFNVSKSQICVIGKRRKWKHV
jgi:hypothetical protein